MRCMFCTKRVGLEIMTRDEYRAADKRCSSLMREATTGSVYVVTFVSSAIVGYVFVTTSRMPRCRRVSAPSRTTQKLA
jgi:hypothetical protein